MKNPKAIMFGQSRVSDTKHDRTQFSVHYALKQWPTRYLTLLSQLFAPKFCIVKNIRYMLSIFSM